MSLISPNFDVKSIIFSQFWQGPFSKIAGKGPAILWLCCYVSSRRPSDVGSIVTNCSCTWLLIGYTEPKLVYSEPL